MFINCEIAYGHRERNKLVEISELCTNAHYILINIAKCDEENHLTGKQFLPRI